MLQYNIPQFIDTEDKVIGPISLRQFAFLVIGTVIIGFLWAFKPNLAFFIVLTVPVVLLSIAFAFVKINGRDFIDYIGSMIGYFLKNQMYLWKREVTNEQPVIKSSIQKSKLTRQQLPRKEYSQSKVDQIAWTLDTYGEKTVLGEDT
jgi:hypothetical protein